MPKTISAEPPFPDVQPPFKIKKGGIGSCDSRSSPNHVQLFSGRGSRVLQGLCFGKLSMLGMVVLTHRRGESLWCGTSTP